MIVITEINDTFEVTAKDTGQCRDATRNVCGCLNGRGTGESLVPFLF